LAFTFAHGCAVPVDTRGVAHNLSPKVSLEVYEDKGGTETFDSVQSQKFHPTKQAVPNFGFSRSVYWIRLSATNPAPEPQTFYLRIINHWLDYIDIFVRARQNRNFEHLLAGARVPWDKRVPERRGPVIRLHFAPEETKTIYIRVQSKTPVRVPIFLLSEAAYDRDELETVFMVGIFCGILGFLIVYNLLAWSILKQSAYLYYILLLVCIGLHQLAWDDLLPHISVFSHPEAIVHRFTSILTLVYIFNLLFVGSFMDGRRKYPICYRIFDILLIGSVALAILSLVNFYLGNYLSFIFAQIVAWSLALTIGFMWYKGETHGRYLFLAHAQFPVVAALAICFTMGILPYNPILAQVIKVGYLLQGIFFSLALADKFAVMQRNFQHILETTVAERSAELVTANRDLQSEIRERERTEEQLRQAKEAAEAGARAKTEFLANMSHEVRTPLNAILGMIDLLLDSDLTSRQRSRAQIVKSAADTLLVLVNDVLDFSKIEAGKLDLEEIDFDIKAVMWSIESLLADRAASKNLLLKTSVSDSVPQFLKGDPGRLRQVLLNLGNNSVKFTEEGEISITADSAEQVDDDVEVHFSVSDTGIGIPQEKLAAIFDRFSQVDSSTTRKYGGTGLGLTISAQLSKAMGGELWVESEPGKGSTFHFTVHLRLGGPVETPDVPTGQAAKLNTNLVGMKILLAEDNAFNQAVAVELLRKQGCEVVVASNGKEAVEAFDSDKFDVILMDLQMPEVDGFEATQIIRAKESSTRIPIIAQTAHAYIEDRERCLNVGMDDYVSKPINATMLVKVLERFAPSRRHGSAEAEDVPSQTQCGDSSGTDDKIFDIESLLNRLGGDHEAAREMVDLFFAEIPALTANLRSAALDKEWELLAKHSHSLKGACATFGAVALAALAAEIEQAAKGHHNARLQTLLSQMEFDLSELKQHVEKLEI